MKLFNTTIIIRIKWIYSAISIAAGIMIISSLPAKASGVGLQIVSGGGVFLNERADDFYSKHNNIASTMTIGCGFVADTNLGGKSIFNYRFRLGYDFQRGDYPDMEDLHRVSMTHIFGAGIYADEYLRLWVGPQVGFGYMWGSNGYYVGRYTGINVFPYYKYWDIMDYSQFNISVGLCLGLNIAIGPSVSIPIEAGIRFNIYTDFEKHDEDGYEKKLFSVMGPEGYAAIGVMYRFNESSAAERGARP